MTISVIKHMSWAWGLALVLQGCNGAGFGGSDKDGDKRKASDAAEGSPEKDSDEASTPVNVAGSYLVQDMVDQARDDVKTDDQKAVIGVLARDERSQRIVDTDMTYAVNINGQRRNVFPGKPNEGPHFYYLVNYNEVDGASSEVTVTRSNGTTISDKKPLSDIVRGSREYAITRSSDLDLVMGNGYAPSGSCFNPGIPKPVYKPKGPVSGWGAETFLNFGNRRMDKAFDPSDSNSPYMPRVKCFVSLKRWDLLTEVLIGSTTTLPGYARESGCYTFFSRDTDDVLRIRVTPMNRVKRPDRIEALVRSKMCP